MGDSFVAGVVAGYALAVPIGAVGLYLLSLGGRSSLRIAAAGALAAAIMDGLYALVATTAGSRSIDVFATVSGALRCGSAGLLGLLGLRSVLNGVRAQKLDSGRSIARRTSARREFATLFAITAVNPATLVYFTALVVGLHGRANLHPAPFVVGAFTASASWQLLLAYGGVRLGRIVGSVGGRRALDIGAGLVIMAFAIPVALTGK